MAKRQILAVALTAAGLALAGCSSATPGTEMPQDELHQSAASPQPEADASASASESTTTEELATQVGVVFAAQLGFDQSQKISDEQLKELAKTPADTLDDVVVLPAQCEQPLEQLNWSPAQLGTQAARSDFSNSSGNVTGSIEVAELPDRDAVEEHYRTVLQMRTECSSVKLNWTDFTETLKFANPGLEGVESQLSYTRRGNSDTAQDTLVLMQTKGEHVAMVSFISATSLADGKINEVAKQILDSVLAQL